MTGSDSRAPCVRSAPRWHRSRGRDPPPPRRGSPPPPRRPPTCGAPLHGRPGCLTGARMALDRKAWNEPGGADAVRLEQSEDALRAEKPELPARERGRAGHAAGDEPRLRIEVEAQTDDVTRHPALPNVDTGAIHIA